MAPSPFAGLPQWLPQGRTLPPADRQRRHHALLILLWLHVGGLPIFAVLRGNSLEHSLLEGSEILVFALAAHFSRGRPRVQSVAVSVGLMACSAELVHLWDGQIEAHFHFFVMVSLLALYEDWLPFGLAFAFVVAHHGVVGVIEPASVYNHAAALANPWRWALIHGGFIACGGAAAVVSWRLNEATRARMAHQSLHDPLTNLPNRLLFSDRLSVALARTQRGEALHAVMFLDVDDFKLINDSLGHHAGDAALLEVAARLDRLVRANDTVARFGGDEFTILATDLESEDAALVLADRIASAIREPIRVGARDIALSASIGIALTRGGETTDDLLRDADAAMYRSKEQGRGRIEVFDGALHTRALRRLDTENELRLALERGELRTHYQPNVRLDTREIVGVEALVRWEHPERGLLAPAEFIPLAEDTGLIVPLGHWVLREACQRAAAWASLGAGDTPVVVSVNLSRRQLSQPDLLEVVSGTLRETGLPASSLCLEITETTVMSDLAGSVATLGALKALGVKLAIDDFGVGFSSLSQLVDLPVDMLKVDKAFVDHIDEDDHRAIIAAILSLAHALGLTAVAEGVEQASQASELAALGCELGQGYLFARPQPPEQIEALLSSELLVAR